MTGDSLMNRRSPRQNVAQKAGPLSSSETSCRGALRGVAQSKSLHTKQLNWNPKVLRLKLQHQALSAPAETTGGRASFG